MLAVPMVWPSRPWFHTETCSPKASGHGLACREKSAVLDRVCPPSFLPFPGLYIGHIRLEEQVQQVLMFENGVPCVVNSSVKVTMTLV